MSTSNGQRQLFRGGMGGRYRVQVTRRPLEVFVDLPAGATWKDYIDAVQEQIKEVGTLGVDHWCKSSVRVDVLEAVHQGLLPQGEPE